MRHKQLISALKALGMTMCVVSAMPVFAEAPVFDADTMQQDVEASNDQTQQPQQAQFDVMPPPPGQESGFVSEPSPQPSVAPPAPTMSSSASDQRVRRLEEQVKTLQTDSAASRVGALQQEVQTLRGQLDELTHQLQQAQSQQKTMYSDLDKRLSMNKEAAPESAPAAVATTPQAATPAKTVAAAAPAPAKTTRVLAALKPAAAAASNQQPDVAEEQKIYQTAYNLIKAKKYTEAVDALQAMLKKYPTGQFASNAHYWLGELYGLLGKNEQALTEFTTVVKSYTSSPRVSDAQFKIGLIYAAQVKWSEAKSAFKKVINEYPGSGSAKLAALQLKQIKEAGH